MLAWASACIFGVKKAAFTLWRHISNQRRYGWRNNKKYTQAKGEKKL